MAAGYGQYCPLALATEILCRRWTILVISRLLDGLSQFNEIHQGLPRMSPSLLSQRLNELVAEGIVEKRPSPTSSKSTYHLTDSGMALSSIIDGLAIWGQHWARDMQMDDLDPAFLAWSMHLRMDLESMPKERTVIEFSFTGVVKEWRQFWLVSEGGKIDMCLKHPGFETDLLVQSDLRLFVEIWRGIRSLEQQIDKGKVKLVGPSHLRRSFHKWLKLSMYAKYDRLRDGAENRALKQ